MKCDLCNHNCNIPEGGIGACRARGCRDGQIVPLCYGIVSSLAVDPIEKKPLVRFMPGSVILSAGFYGCNMSCPFCQNHGIAQTAVPENPEEYYELTPEELFAIAERTHRESGNIGIAYTYNEPLTNFEFVRDTARLIHDAGMKNVVVTNGQLSIPYLEEILPCIDAMNVDLKAFSDEGYKRLGGSFEASKSFIERSCRDCHIEVTSLIVPGLNDSTDDMDAEAQWLASLDGDITLHITRYFPRYRMTEGAPTDIGLLHELADTARRYLDHVYIGNV